MSSTLSDVQQTLPVQPYLGAPADGTAAASILMQDDGADIIQGTPPRRTTSARAPSFRDYDPAEHTPELLINYFTERLLLTPTPYSNLDTKKTRQIHKEESFGLFNINVFPPRRQHENEDVLRITLDTGFRIALAYEGPPCNDTPAHSEMAGSCIYAGNITLNEGRQIKSINHKSGDFRPDFSSIAFVLQVLANYPEKLADSIEIEKLTSSGGSEKTFTLTKELLLLLPLAKPELKAIQPTYSTTITRPVTQSESAAKRRRVHGFSGGLHFAQSPALMSGQNSPDLPTKAGSKYEQQGDNTFLSDYSPVKGEYEVLMRPIKSRFGLFITPTSPITAIPITAISASQKPDQTSAGVNAASSSDDSDNLRLFSAGMALRK